MIHVMIAAVAVPKAAMAASWVYANPGQTQANAAAQEATWGGLCNTGREQSPVDVITTEVVPTSSGNILTNYSGVLEYVKNTGKGFQLFETSPNVYKQDATTGTWEVDALGSPKGYAMIHGERYNFYQVHWHSPSENTIDGVSYPLEAHFVHQLDDVAVHGTYHRLAVVGLLYELGECNELLDSFWSQFPQTKGVQPYSGPTLDLNTKLSQEFEAGYYHWFGSLTTPPCTEGVSWNLLKVKQTVCQRQIDAIQTALGETQNGIRFNNRVTMPLNHRTITETNAKHSLLSASSTSETSDVTNVALLVLAAVIIALAVALLTLFVLLCFRVREVRRLIGSKAKSGAQATPELESGTHPSGNRVPANNSEVREVIGARPQSVTGATPKGLAPERDTHPSGSDVPVTDGEVGRKIVANPQSVTGATPGGPQCPAPPRGTHPSGSGVPVKESEVTGMSVANPKGVTGATPGVSQCSAPGNDTRPSGSDEPIRESTKQSL